MARRFGNEARWFRDEPHGHDDPPAYQPQTPTARSSRIPRNRGRPTASASSSSVRSNGAAARPSRCFSVEDSGSNLTQLTDTHSSSTFACIDWPRSRVLFAAGDVVRGVGLDDFREEELFHLPGASGFGCMTMHPDGRSALTTFTQGRPLPPRATLAGEGRARRSSSRTPTASAARSSAETAAARSASSGSKLNALPTDSHQAFLGPSNRTARTCARRSASRRGRGVHPRHVAGARARW